MLPLKGIAVVTNAIVGRSGMPVLILPRGERKRSPRQVKALAYKEEVMLFASLDDRGAELSPCGIYRYALTREWEDGPCIAWLMFNPSTADATVDDATIRKCVGFSKRWGFGRLVVVNLYAVRSRDPKAVARTTDPVGPLNNYWITEALGESRQLICAWGCAQHMRGIDGRIIEVLKIAREEKVETLCLGQRKDSHPRHPLMLAYSTERVPFEAPC